MTLLDQWAPVYAKMGAAWQIVVLSFTRLAAGDSEHYLLANLCNLRRYLSVRRATLLMSRHPSLGTFGFNNSDDWAPLWLQSVGKFYVQFAHAELTSIRMHMCRWWSLAHHHSTGLHVQCCSEGCWQRLPAAASCRSTLPRQAPCTACCCLLCRQRGERHARVLYSRHA